MSNDVSFKNISHIEHKLNHTFNVVVVDDDYATVEVFSEYLELANNNVIGKAFDGKQAVEIFKQTRPDFIFLDVMMPEYDGFYALERIKHIDQNARVIAVTADLTSVTEKRLQKLGVSCIIYKPFDIDSIISIMQSLFEKKGIIEQKVRGT